MFEALPNLFGIALSYGYMVVTYWKKWNKVDVTTICGYLWSQLTQTRSGTGGEEKDESNLLFNPLPAMNIPLHLGGKSQASREGKLGEYACDLRH